MTILELLAQSSGKKFLRGKKYEFAAPLNVRCLTVDGRNKRWQERCFAAGQCHLYDSGKGIYIFSGIPKNGKKEFYFPVSEDVANCAKEIF